MSCLPIPMCLAPSDTLTPLHTASHRLTPPHTPPHTPSHPSTSPHIPSHAPLVRHSPPKAGAGAEEGHGPLSPLRRGGTGAAGAARQSFTPRSPLGATTDRYGDRGWCGYGSSSSLRPLWAILRVRQPAQPPAPPPSPTHPPTPFPPLFVTQGTQRRVCPQLVLRLAGDRRPPPQSHPPLALIPRPRWPSRSECECGPAVVSLLLPRDLRRRRDRCHEP